MGRRCRRTFSLVWIPVADEGSSFTSRKQPSMEVVSQTVGDSNREGRFMFNMKHFAASCLLQYGELRFPRKMRAHLLSSL